MSGLIFGEKDGGGIAPVRVDEEGRLVTTSAGGGGTTSEVTGPAGEELATEATAADIATSAQALAGAVDGNAIRTVDGSPTFTAAPPGATQAPAVRVVGDGIAHDGSPIQRVQVENGAEFVAIQGEGDPMLVDPWIVGSVVSGEVKPLATQETAEAALAEVADDATTADVQAVRDRLPAALDGGRLVVETELSSAGPLGTEASASASAASLANIAPGVPDTLGAAGGMRIEGVAGGTAVPVSAAALPLPVGAATNASVDEVEGKLGTLAAQEATLLTRATETTLVAVQALLTTIRDRLPVLGRQAIAASQSVIQATAEIFNVKQGAGSRRTNGEPTSHTAPILVVAGAVKLRSVYAQYTGAGTRYLWVFDAATAPAGAAAGNAVPPSLLLTNAGGLRWQNWPEVGLTMANGIVLALSSTQNTYTASADLWTLQQVTWET